MYALPKKAGQYYQDIVDIIAEHGGPKPVVPEPVVLPVVAPAPELERQDLFPTGYRPLSEEQKEESEKAEAQRYINNIQTLTTYFRPEDWARTSKNDKIDTYQIIKILFDMKAGRARVSKYLKPYLDFKLPEKVQKGYDNYIAQGKPSKYSGAKPEDDKKKLAKITQKIQSLFFPYNQATGSEKEKIYRQILKLEEEQQKYKTEMTPTRRAALKKFNEENNEHIY
jgi:hypothetical protein